MGIKSFLADKFFGGEIQRQVDARMQAAGSSLDEAGWRRLSGNANRELPVATWQRQVEICYWLWKTNPLGNWIIESLASFVVGKGFTYTAGPDAVEELLNEFWFDPVNRMDIRLKRMVRELFLFGVQCWPVFKGEQTGRVRLGTIDPALIVEVYTDPENVEIIIGLKVQHHSDTTRTRILRTILTGESETVVSEEARALREGWTEGECFFFSINNVSNDPLGTSDLFPIADWIDEYERFVFDYAEKTSQMNAFVWDVEIAGADPKQIADYAKDNPAPKPGSTRYHNEKVKWTAVAPDLKALDVSNGARLFRNHILGNRSIPEHFYGGGGDVNRATAGEMDAPFYAMIEDRQNLVKHILETIFTYVVQSSLDAGYLHAEKGEDPFDFAVQKPEAKEKDLAKVSTAVRDIITSLVAASAQNWIDKDSAVKVFAFVLALIGYELDPEAMDLDDPEYSDYKTGPKSKVPGPGSKGKQPEEGAEE
jgi:hypothetical protein